MGARRGELAFSRLVIEDLREFKLLALDSFYSAYQLVASLLTAALICR